MAGLPVRGASARGPSPVWFLFRRGAQERTPGGKVLLLFVLFSVLTFGLFAPDARHRLPLALVMSPFAALAVADWARADRWKSSGQES